ncbi:hypothetical protein KC217_22525, partial [Mycobacterium tuberculosis]|nr:hypothetical protein [Mycobacterium tuberculosis]
ATTGTPHVDVTVDRAEHKGIGRWPVRSALGLGVPVPAAASASVVVGTQWLSAKRAWSLYDPATGTERQALGLGAAVSSVRPLAW